MIQLTMDDLPKQGDSPDNYIVMKKPLAFSGEVFIPAGTSREELDVILKAQ